MADALTVDDIVLDESNKLFFDAAKLVLETDKQIIYLTGKAGTGKTTFLKFIRQSFKGNCVVLASTGIAAINAGGQTIHSFFKLNYAPCPPDDTRLSPPEIYDVLKYKKDHIELINNLSLIIVDEVSMVRGDVLDSIDRVLKVYRKNKAPFGGVKILLIGDTFQLPPVVDDSTWNVLKLFYPTPYFFSSIVYSNCNPIYLELEKPYRQRELEFINILNKIRVNKISDEELGLLNQRVSPIAVSDIQEGKEEPILLAPTNYLVNNYNTSRFEVLTSDIYPFEGVVQGDFPEKMMMAEKMLKLRVGAQVMILRNKKREGSLEYEYHNGAIGIIEKINLELKTITVKLSQKTVEIETVIWENLEYTWSKEEKRCKIKVKGTYVQIPLKLAWAITIHKSQGLTFDNVNADLANCFDYGQVYVALSRCRKFSGLKLKSPIQRNAIKTDHRILSFVETKTPHTLIVEELQKGKADGLYRKTRQALDNNFFEEMFDSLNEAIKIRDDRGTPEFKRYIKTKLQQFHDNKNKVIRQSEMIGYLETDILCLEEAESILTSEVDDLNEEYQKLIDVVVSHKQESAKIIKNLSTSEQQLKRENNELKEKVRDLTLRINEQNEKYENLKNEFTIKDILLESVRDKLFKMEGSLNREILELKKQLSDASIEIYILQNVTWWQKLFTKRHL